MNKKITQYLNFCEADINFAAKLLKEGKLVAFPTETVFGLGANALLDDAVRSIFLAKGRPADNPLIVHVAKTEQIFDVATELSNDAKIVVERFFPGSLTVVLKRGSMVSSLVSAGLSTVAVRIPKSKEAQWFLEACGVPVAAPSANLSSRVSPTSWQAVKSDMDGRIDAVLCGSDCEVGIESTVLDLSRDKPLILRPGIVTAEEISSVLKKSVPVLTNPKEKVNSPGVRYKHYAPVVPAILNVDGNTKKVCDFFDQLQKEGKNPVILAKDTMDFSKRNCFSLGKTDEDVARNLYSALRLCESKFDFIIICYSGNSELSQSILNRLEKSVSGQYL